MRQIDQTVMFLCINLSVSLSPMRFKTAGAKRHGPRILTETRWYMVNGSPGANSEGINAQHTQQKWIHSVSSASLGRSRYLNGVWLYSVTHRVLGGPRITTQTGYRDLILSAFMLVGEKLYLLALRSNPVALTDGSVVPPNTPNS